jgi:hypothetical protein
MRSALAVADAPMVRELLGISRSGPFFLSVCRFWGQIAEELYIQDIFPEQELANQSEVSSFGDSVEEVGLRAIILCALRFNWGVERGL